MADRLSRTAAVALAERDYQRRRVQLEKLRTKAFRAAHDEGWSYRQIAAATGLSRQRVGQIVARTLAAIVAVLAVASFSVGSARASSPDPVGIQSGLRVGAAMFGTPPCGAPKVAVAPGRLTPNGIGWALTDTCTVQLTSDYEWVGRQEVCTIMVHEWGHLALGPVFGGSDPWHSTDPQSVMFPSPLWLSACSPPATVRPAPRVRRVRVHRVKWGKGKVRHPRVRTLRAVIR